MRFPQTRAVVTAAAAAWTCLLRAERQVQHSFQQALQQQDSTACAVGFCAQQQLLPEVPAQAVAV
jgi:hypothetical protein